MKPCHFCTNRLLAAVLAGTIGPTTALAQDTHTWTGSATTGFPNFDPVRSFFADDNWQNGNNQAFAPVAGDDLLFRSSADVFFPVDSPAIRNLTINDPAGASGIAVSFSDPDSPATFTLTGNLNIGTAGNTTRSKQLINTLDGFDVTGTLALLGSANGSSTFVMNGDNATAGTVDLQDFGVFTQQGGSFQANQFTLSGPNSSAELNAGQFQATNFQVGANGSATVANNANITSLSVDAQGSFVINGAADVTVGGVNGNIDFQNGELTLTPTVFDVSTDSPLGSNITLASTEVSPGTFTRRTLNTTGQTVIGTGTSITVDAGNTFNADGGVSLTGTGALSSVGEYLNPNGNDPGNISRLTASNITAGDQSRVLLEGGELVVTGTVTLNDTATMEQLVSPNLSNGESTFRTQGGSGVQANALVLNNNAVYRMAETGAYLRADSITAAPTATFDYQAGTLRTRDLTVGSTGPLGASLTIDNKKNLDLQDSALTIQNGGSVVLDGGFLTLKQLNNAGSFTFTSGNLIPFDTTFVVGSTGWLGSTVKLGDNADAMFQRIGGFSSTAGRTTDLDVESNATLTLERLGNIEAEKTTVRSGGTLTVDGGRLSSNEILRESGGTLNFQSGVLTTADVSVAANGILGSSINLTSATSTKSLAVNTLNVESGGSVALNDDNFLRANELNIAAGGSVQIDGGTFNVQRVRNNGGSFDWTGGTFDAVSVSSDTVTLVGSVPFGSLGEAVFDTPLTIVAGASLEINGRFLDGDNVAPGFQNQRSEYSTDDAWRAFRTSAPAFVSDFERQTLRVGAGGTVTNFGTITAFDLEVDGTFNMSGGLLDLVSNPNGGGSSGGLSVGSGGLAALTGGTLRVASLGAATGGSININGSRVELINPDGLSDASSALNDPRVTFNSGTIKAVSATLNAFNLKAGQTLDIATISSGVVVDGGVLNTGGAFDVDFKTGTLAVNGGSWTSALSTTIGDGSSVSVDAETIVAQDQTLTVDGGIFNTDSLRLKLDSNFVFNRGTSNFNTLINEGGSFSVSQLDSDLRTEGGTTVVGILNGNLGAFGGQTTVTTVNGTVTIDDGVVQVLAVDGSVLNIGEGSFSPGASPALTIIDEDYSQGELAELVIELGGLVPETEYDVLRVLGDVDLAGTLRIALIDGYTPAVGDTFTVFDWDFNTASGSFDNVFIDQIGISADFSTLLTDGQFTITAIPEPSTVLVLGLGMAGSLSRRRRRPGTPA
ncbi:MAG: PEP-CTERM sorting domain-containing protein [Planctomycetota bacterium]